MKIKCEVINDLLPLYVDDVLSKESRELVEEHICECGNCKKKVWPESFSKENPFFLLAYMNKFISNLFIGLLLFKHFYFYIFLH